MLNEDFAAGQISSTWVHSVQTGKYRSGKLWNTTESLIVRFGRVFWRNLNNILGGSLSIISDMLLFIYSVVLLQQLLDFLLYLINLFQGTCGQNSPFGWKINFQLKASYYMNHISSVNSMENLIFKWSTTLRYNRIFNLVIFDLKWPLMTSFELLVTNPSK